MKIGAITQLIKRIETNEWEFHANKGIICNISESNEDYYYCINVFKNTKNNDMVTADFQLRLHNREFEIERVAYRFERVSYVLHSAKRELIDFISNLNFEIQ